MGTASLLNRGFTEGNHLGFSKRDVDAISLTPELGVAHKVEELGSRVAKEAEIIRFYSRGKPSTCVERERAVAREVYLKNPTPPGAAQAT